MTNHVDRECVWFDWQSTIPIGKHLLNYSQWNIEDKIRMHRFDYCKAELVCVESHWVDVRVPEFDTNGLACSTLTVARRMR